ncbi:biotin--[acetyl-CoA-carboxylase] ligase [Pleomorphovibrio marinus]|uniref:biotin--[acetyl-CoA-carboxylase] ligase n=1 Tax=Pleomorphovibrio marinus TaxID=2164132 RepID=UPI000E0C0BFF|nr:biotin--[acetyl-CoA-carboxylase] ligase [Pleomorphovibrio marinus]
MHKILANTVFLGKDIRFLTECHSTSDLAAQYFKEGNAKEGTIVITDKQTRGRGQRGNQWYSEPSKNLTFSLVLTPTFLDATEQFYLSMAVSLGVHDALSAYIGEIYIKWPNDFVHQKSGKIGGMLIENQLSTKGIDLSIVGIGINVNQTSFPFPNVTSLALLAGSPIAKEEFFKFLVKAIEDHYLLLSRGRRRHIRNSYLERLFRANEWALFDDGELFEGKILGITDEGKLRIEKQDGRLISYAFKEVSFIW